MAAYAVTAVFYAAYFLKMLRQRRKGITTDVMTKGDKPSALRRQEVIMKAATALITDGIYRFSRNPAFLGFDLLYLCLVALDKRMHTNSWQRDTHCGFYL